MVTSPRWRASGATASDGWSVALSQRRRLGGMGCEDRCCRRPGHVAVLNAKCWRPLRELSRGELLPPREDRIATLSPGESQSAERLSYVGDVAPPTRTPFHARATATPRRSGRKSLQNTSHAFVFQARCPTKQSRLTFKTPVPRASHGFHSLKSFINHTAWTLLAGHGPGLQPAA